MLTLVAFLKGIHFSVGVLWDMKHISLQNVPPEETVSSQVQRGKNKTLSKTRTLYTHKVRARTHSDISKVTLSEIRSVTIRTDTYKSKRNLTF